MNAPESQAAPAHQRPCRFSRRELVRRGPLALAVVPFSQLFVRNLRGLASEAAATADAAARAREIAGAQR